jgi:hypothetical protein
MFSENKLYAAQRAIMKNWIFFVAIYLLILIWQVNQLGELKEAIDENSRLQEKSMTSVIGLTDNGVVLDIERKALYADSEEALVVRALRKLVVARAELTQGFSLSEFNTPQELLAHTEALNDFTEYLLVDEVKAKDITINIKNDEGKLETLSVIDLSKKGVGYFIGYLEKLRQMIQQNTLTHFATIYKTNVKSFTPDGESFKIKVLYHVSTQTWLGYDKDKSIFRTHDNVYEIEAQGFFNIRLRTKKSKQFKGINKLGLKFYKLQISVPTTKKKL